MKMQDVRHLFAELDALAERIGVPCRAEKEDGVTDHSEDDAKRTEESTLFHVQIFFLWKAIVTDSFGTVTAIESGAVPCVQTERVAALAGANRPFPSISNFFYLL